MGVGETLDIVEFAESVTVLELSEYQKDILRKAQEVVNKGVIFVRGRFGTYVIPNHVQIKKSENVENKEES